MTGPKHVTDKQLAANRRNAQHSTGPRTPEGKARSRWNALVHGALAQAAIPPELEPYESRAAFEDLLAVLRDELAPASAMEEILVERIATSYWRLSRVLRAESATIAARQENTAADEARDEAFAALVPGIRPTSLDDQVQLLAEALGDTRRLRKLMVQADPRWRDVSDQELITAAQSLLGGLRAQSADQQARRQSRQRDQRSIPHLNTAIQFARYETTLERQIYRALDALERLQRLRAGEVMPPPLQVSVDVNTDLATIDNPDQADDLLVQ